ncbi:MAG TPA: metalloregulator ArsR/SmtB family transcription factor [Anaerolineaceae bacterium]|nr:metalloregulator ArsR/SmtB family transcription factor [Anaerolineaceae bacterium]HOD03488.1 metalloregulator ArsR/SmtB family transcription factor [Anaerolineaceae bacterium]HOG78373.1 metalloregulator ArsR/SmtB family transcription factor [Anaerolineaceae bacterium]
MISSASPSSPPLSPSLSWDIGSAYDFFVSIYVLHRPADFGLRPSWAAGVRSRLAGPVRDFLEETQNFLTVPLPWLHDLPAVPKTAVVALEALAALPAADRLPALSFSPETTPELREACAAIAARGSWTNTEADVIRAVFQRRNITPRPGAVQQACQAWSDPAAFGERYLEAVQLYNNVFFREEEARITPALENALTEARALAARLPVADLLDELTRGVHFQAALQLDQLVLAPSFWSAPLVFYRPLQPGRAIMLFGARPADQPLVPGENIPADLVDGLKALADPTRLRILRNLAEGPQTPSELARQVRLRPPTVIHHLNQLRLSGLVEITVQAEGERRYALRQEALAAVIATLKAFIQPESE